MDTPPRGSDRADATVSRDDATVNRSHGNRGFASFATGAGAQRARAWIGADGLSFRVQLPPTPCESRPIPLH